MRLRESQFNIQELEQENRKLNTTIHNLKAEIEKYIETIDKLKQDKNLVLKMKSETEELEDLSKKELVKRFQLSLGKILDLVSKTKKKYQHEIFQFKLEIEKLNSVIESNLIIIYR